MGSVTRINHSTVVVVYCKPAYYTVVGTFLQYDNTIANTLPVIFGNLLGVSCLGKDEYGAVLVFAYEYDIRTVDDYFLVISTLADENLKRLFRCGRSLLDGKLDAVTRIDYCIEVGYILNGFSEPVDGSVLRLISALFSGSYFLAHFSYFL